VITKENSGVKTIWWSLCTAVCCIFGSLMLLWEKVLQSKFFLHILCFINIPFNFFAADPSCCTIRGIYCPSPSKHWNHEISSYLWHWCLCASYIKTSH